MEVINKWNNIKLIVSDFDGVMTDNRVLVDENGIESVFVSRADGQGVHILRSINIELIILSTEANNVVTQRAKKLGVKCIQNAGNKAECLKNYCTSNNISFQNICYIGNDINDFEAMKLANLKIVPNDAYNEVKNIADYITTTQGGYGVIREVAGMFVSAKHKNSELIN